ncbi:phage tail protein [Deinococcus arcticus]|uniref:Phage tail protein n=1 Tax=Deinococcus arcticus TaxID=2136176 RepID=A0A2T3W9D7_9DEIO|nr:tail fiber protein [Deinococcus arcticus]PTA68506.1 phage tail protein [Deinococcus arcticus]
MTPYLGEIRMFAGTFAPVGWALCEGQLLPISQYDALFVLIGTTYGGDGQSTFALPDMRGRLPAHVGTPAGGQPLALGQLTGTETVTVSAAQVPAHSHALQASTLTAPQGGGVSAGAFLAQPDGSELYVGSGRRPQTLAAAAVAASGGAQPHENLSPYLCVNFIIALEGIFPSRN